MLSDGIGKPQPGEAPERKKQNPTIVQLKGVVFAFLESPCDLLSEPRKECKIVSFRIAVVFDSHFRIFEFIDRWRDMV